MPVNGATAPSVGVLQTYLDSVYRQANVRFTVTEKTGFRFNIDSVGVAGLARAGSGINKYSAEMRMIRDKFAIDTTYDKKASYIFVVSAFEGGGLDGFMVRGRSMGFVASGANKRTYAHELGHGAFGLEHTFPEIGQSLSNNLMDYGDSTHLTHKQCKDIAKRKFVFNWLDSEEDASFNKGFAISPNWQLVYTNTNVGSDAYTKADAKGKTSAPDGFLGGFWRSEKVNGSEIYIKYSWNPDVQTYEPQTPYNIPKYAYATYALANNLGNRVDSDLIWLYYDNHLPCGQGAKILKTTYKHIKAYILSKKDSDLQAYIYSNRTKTSTTIPIEVHSYDVPCGATVVTTSTKGYDNFVITSNNQIVDFTHRIINGASSSRVTDPVIQKALAAINSINTGTSIISKVFIIDFESEVEATLKPKWTLANTEITNHISKIHASSTSKEQILVIRLPKAGSSTQMEVEFYLGGGFGNRAEIEEFFCFNKVANPSDVSDNILRYTVDFLEYISSLIQKGEIPERFYNPKAPKYNNVLLQFMPPSFISGAMAQAFTSFLPAGYQIKNEEEARQMHLAFLCGIWNGGISLLADIPSGASFIIKFTNNSKLCNGSGVGFRDDLINKLKSLDKEKIKQLFAQMLAPYVNNVPMISYTVGNVTFAILSGILTAGTGAGANIITKTLKVIEKLDALGRLTGGAFGSILNITFDAVGAIKKIKILRNTNTTRIFTTPELNALANKVKDVIPVGSNKLYVLLHTDNAGKFLVMEGSTQKMLTGDELASYFSGNNNPKRDIVLLSCNDLDAAKALAQSADVDVYTTNGSLSLYDNGVKQDTWYKVQPDGTQQTTTAPVKECNPCTGTGTEMALNKFKNVTPAILADLSTLLGGKYNDFILILDRLPKSMSVQKTNGKIRILDAQGREWAEVTATNIKATAGTGSGGWNKLLNMNPPLMKGFEYRVDNNFVFKTDAEGRVSEIIVEDLKVDVSRPRYEGAQQNAKELKDGATLDSDGWSDDGGHMVRAQFFGPSEQINYFPQNAAKNRPPGEWFNMEEDVKNLKLANPTAVIRIEIVPTFGDPTKMKRPTSFVVKVYQGGTQLPANQGGLYRIDNPFQ